MERSRWQPTACVSGCERRSLLCGHDGAYCRVIAESEHPSATDQGAQGGTAPLSLSLSLTDRSIPLASARQTNRKYDPVRPY